MRRSILAGLLVLGTVLGSQATAPAPARADAYPGANGAAFVLRSSAGNGDILALNPTNFAASTYAPVVTAGDVSSMSVSPNGRRIAFASTAYAPSAIFVMDIDSRAPIRITTPTAGVEHRSPSWSPGRFTDRLQLLRPRHRVHHADRQRQRDERL